MAEKIYLKINQQNNVYMPRVRVSDVADIFCADADMAEKVGDLELAHFTKGIFERRVFDALSAVRIINRVFPDDDVCCMGECDFVVEYRKRQKNNGMLHWLKVGAICLITMVGSAYGIIAYNNDVSTTDIFDRMYALFGAASLEQTNIMEVAYAVGLFVGIVVFYDHFAGHKISKAPTPLEVEMDKYNKDVTSSVIDRADSRNRGGRSQ